MYKQVKIQGSDGVEKTHIIRTNSEKNYTSFPADESNTDYQKYLEWVAQGNTPEPADE